MNEVLAGELYKLKDKYGNLLKAPYSESVLRSAETKNMEISGRDEPHKYAASTPVERDNAIGGTSVITPQLKANQQKWSSSEDINHLTTTATGTKHLPHKDDIATHFQLCFQSFQDHYMLSLHWWSGTTSGDHDISDFNNQYERLGAWGHALGVETGDLDAIMSKNASLCSLVCDLLQKIRVLNSPDANCDSITALSDNDLEDDFSAGPEEIESPNSLLSPNEIDNTENPILDVAH